MARHLLVTNDYPPKTGGIQVYLHELWRRLEPGRGVILTASSHELAESFDANTNVVIERSGTRTLFFPTFRTLRTIERAIEQHQPDLVLLDPAWPLGLVGPRLKVPYGVVLHGAEVAIPGRLPFVSSTLRYVLRHASVALCAGTYPEQEARRVAAEHMPPVIQIPPGVDTNSFVPVDEARRQEVRNEMGLTGAQHLVASYSRLVPRKGMDTLIKAAAALAKDVPGLHVAIGGSGRDSRRLEKLATKLHAPVTFLGRVPDEQLSDWLASSDLMVMDCRSRWLGLEQEGFGIVFLNAAACGVAQIAGRSGGSHEAVLDGVTGTVVANPRSVSALRDAMVELLTNDELREAYGRNARSLAEARFDWDTLGAHFGDELAQFDHFNIGAQLA
jgi:phosphatidylinositol alpha-1,6-mannosyltransferase